MASAFTPVLRTLSKDLAIDLGTANTLVYLRGTGLVCNEPSVVAIRYSPDGHRRILAVGTEAKKMLGRTPAKITVTRPVRDGVISDFDATHIMLRYFISKVCARNKLILPRIIVAVPAGITTVGRRAVVEAVKALGAGEVYLVDQAIAAAIGAGLPVTEPLGNMIVDIGGGTTEIGVISLGGLVYSRSLLIGGNRIDEAIVRLLRRRYNIEIGERAAEIVKIMIGSASHDPQLQTLEIKVQHLAARTPKIVVITNEDVHEAISGPVEQLIEAMRIALENIPPELAADIAERGIVLAGGGALLRNLDSYMSEKINLPITICDDPLKAVVLGASKLLEDSAVLEIVSLNDEAKWKASL